MRAAGEYEARTPLSTLRAHIRCGRRAPRITIVTSNFRFVAPGVTVELLAAVSTRTIATTVFAPFAVDIDDAEREVRSTR